MDVENTAGVHPQQVVNRFDNAVKSILPQPSQKMAIRYNPFENPNKVFEDFKSDILLKQSQTQLVIGVIIFSVLLFIVMSWIKSFLCNIYSEISQGCKALLAMEGSALPVFFILGVFFIFMSYRIRATNTKSLEARLNLIVYNIKKLIAMKMKKLEQKSKIEATQLKKPEKTK